METTAAALTAVMHKLVSIDSMSKIIKYGGGFLVIVIGVTGAAGLFMPKPDTQIPQDRPPAVASVSTSAVDIDRVNAMQQIAQGVSKIGEGVKNIDRIEVTSTSATGITYALWYSDTATYTAARDHTTLLIRSTLKELKTRGLIKPNEPLFLHAHAYQVVDGETRPIVRKYGSASYDFNKDQIKFELAK